MRAILLSIGLSAMATGGLAGTLSEVIAHGVVLTIGSADIPITFAPDGKFTANDGQITGVWRIDGDQLCTITNPSTTETCVAYPPDKKSGDTFDLPAGDGTVKIKIR